MIGQSPPCYPCRCSCPAAAARWRQGAQSPPCYPCCCSCPTAAALRRQGPPPAALAVTALSCRTAVQLGKCVQHAPMPCCCTRRVLADTHAHARTRPDSGLPCCPTCHMLSTHVVAGVKGACAQPLPPFVVVLLPPTCVWDEPDDSIKAHFLANHRYCHSVVHDLAQHLQQARATHTARAHTSTTCYLGPGRADLWRFTGPAHSTAQRSTARLAVTQGPRQAAAVVAGRHPLLTCTCASVCRCDAVRLSICAVPVAAVRFLAPAAGSLRARCTCSLLLVASCCCCWWSPACSWLCAGADAALLRGGRSTSAQCSGMCVGLMKSCCMG